MNIIKVSNSHYVCKLPDAVHEELTSIIKDLSLGDMSAFEAGTTHLLYDSMLARRVAAEMKKQGIVLHNDGFAVVEVSGINNTINISVGQVSMDGPDPVYVSGVLYK